MSTMLIAIGAAIAVFTGIGAGLGISRATAAAWMRSPDNQRRKEDSKHSDLGLCVGRGNGNLWVRYRLVDYNYVIRKAGEIGDPY